MSETELKYSISVARVDIDKLKIPEEICFGTGDFAEDGVDFKYSPKTKDYIYIDRTISDSQEKINFLYTALIDKYFESDIRKFRGYLKYLEKVLMESGCHKVLFEDASEEYNQRKKSWRALIHPDEPYYCIETGNMEDRFFSELIYYNTRRLLSFLFSSKSIVKIQMDKDQERTDVGPEKNTDKVSYGWTWFC